MTHSELVGRAGKWLKVNAGCKVIFTELVTYANENPDAIGWTHCRSFLIECKTSRPDFHADKKKVPRRYPNQCMGNFRFYMAPAGLIGIEELPTGWGLLEVDEKGIVLVEYPAGWRRSGEMLPLGIVGLRNERMVMYSALRRMDAMGYLKHVKDKP
ncbi:MAG: hypothetical protein JRC86_04850 [Deltaproteobacteria bacterium]|nr:hypothetical protein [Deltaproteobacteria bacterium]